MLLKRTGEADSTTACNNARSITDCKLDCFNWLYYNLPVLNNLHSLACTVRAPKSCQITPIVCSFQWLKVTECIQCKLKLLSLTLQSPQPPHLHYTTSVIPSQHLLFICCHFLTTLSSFLSTCFTCLWIQLINLFLDFRFFVFILSVVSLCCYDRFSSSVLASPK